MTSQNTISSAYKARVASGELTADIAQAQIAGALDMLLAKLVSDEPVSFLSKLFGDVPEAPKGLYIWGGVGRGKSMLMDLFYEHAPITAKRRVHFHVFMQEMHARIHVLRQDQCGADPVLQLAKDIANETQLLCFDEMQAHDVADATLLYRLFEALWERGVVVVSTSNRPPESLYTGEVQKERFGKFIALIKANMVVTPLDSPHDYRTSKEQSQQQRYFSPLGQAANHFIYMTIQRLCKEPTPKRKKIAVQGRELTLNLYDGHIAKFSFASLCEKPLGAADYLAITQHCDTLILCDIPLLSPEKRNEAKRFVTLIDTLYEAKTLLFFTAAAQPDGLYPEGHGAFEFKRTVSRLNEMQSAEWAQST